MSRKGITNQEDFILWMNDRYGVGYTDDIESRLLTALAEIGIQIESMFCETDIQKLRLYISELVLKRNQCKVPEFIRYKELLDYILYYTEFLESIDLVENYKPGVNLTTDTLLVAYYLSKTNKAGLQALGYKTFLEAFQKLSAILKQKVNTVKNMRDEFDPLFDNGRKGWYQRPLSHSRKEVHEKYNNVSFEDMTDIVKKIIDYYQKKNKAKKETTSGHKKIKIETTRLKEIKAKNSKL